MTFVQRLVAPEDREAWESLWSGYLSFYEKRVSQETTELTWRRLTTTDEINGLIAFAPSGEGVGLVHFFYHPSTSTSGDNCYITDLFVAPSARKQGIARGLIAAVVAAAKVRQASLVYWQTEEFNGTARRLYERVAKR